MYIVYMIIMLIPSNVSLCQVDEMYRGAPISEEGMFDYNAFVRMIKHGSKDE